MKNFIVIKVRIAFTDFGKNGHCCNINPTKVGTWQQIFTSSVSSYVNTYF